MTLPELGYVIMLINLRPDVPDTCKDVPALKAALETVGFGVRYYNDCSVEVGINGSMFIFFDILLQFLNVLDKE